MAFHHFVGPYQVRECSNLLTTCFVTIPRLNYSGPGSQQKKNPYEADSLFGRVVQGMEDVVPRIHSTPQTSWLDKVNQIAIPKMTILIPDSENEGEWIPWHPQDDSPVATM